MFIYIIVVKQIKVKAFDSSYEEVQPNSTGQSLEKIEEGSTPADGTIVLTYDYEEQKQAQFIEDGSNKYFFYNMDMYTDHTFNTKIPTAAILKIRLISI